MDRILQALCWAMALIIAAIASQYGVMDRGSSTTLYIVLPIVAWMALSGRGTCSLRRRA